MQKNSFQSHFPVFYPYVQRFFFVLPMTEPVSYAIMWAVYTIF